MPDWVMTRPIRDELTVVDIDPTATEGQADEIL